MERDRSGWRVEVSQMNVEVSQMNGRPMLNCDTITLCYNRLVNFQLYHKLVNVELYHTLVSIELSHRLVTELYHGL